MQITPPRISAFLCVSSRALILLLLALTGCGGTAKHTGLMTEAGDVTVTARELRARGYQYAKRFAAVVEMSADSIMTQSDDPVIRHQALVWKIGAIFAIEQAIFQPDPLGSFVDAWALTLQMRDYFEKGAGNDLFGQWQPIAVGACIRLEVEVSTIAADLGSPEEVSRIADRVVAWAEDHPLTNASFLRDNTIPLWKQVDELSTGMSAVTSMEDTFQDMNTRLNVYAVLLPKQARWQSELVLHEYLETGEMTEFLDNVDRITVAADEVARFTETFDQLVSDETSAALEALRSERIAVLSAVDQQRLATMDEMAAKLAEVLRFIHEERVATMSQMDSVAVSAVEAATPGLEDVIDHFFWRAAQLLAGFLVVCAAGGYVVYRVLGSRGRSSTSTPRDG